MISSTRSSVAACQLPVACISLIRNGLASSRFTMSSTVVLLLRQVSAIVPVAVLQIAHGGGLVRLAGGLGKGGVDEDGRIAGSTNNLLCNRALGESQVFAVGNPSQRVPCFAQRRPEPFFPPPGSNALVQPVEAVAAGLASILVAEGLQPFDGFLIVGVRLLRPCERVGEGARHRGPPGLREGLLRWRGMRSARDVRFVCGRCSQLSRASHSDKLQGNRTKERNRAVAAPSPRVD